LLVAESAASAAWDGVRNPATVVEDNFEDVEAEEEATTLLDVIALLEETDVLDVVTAWLEETDVLDVLAA
jgi:hypothetical protein